MNLRLSTLIQLYIVYGTFRKNIFWMLSKVAVWVDCDTYPLYYIFCLWTLHDHP